ncbi:MAG: hypothetical protein HY784_14835 [Chloroflexi bacterium]|nr:hypothetical protein [Chloroflexota bacterium]
MVRATVFGERGLAGLLAWPGQYALPRSFQLSQLAQGLYAALRALAGFYPLRGDVHTVDFLASSGPLPQIAFVATYGLTGAAVAGALFLGWKSRVTLLVRHRAMAAMLVLWATGYGLFALYWQPGDVQFWSPVLVPFWLLVAMTFRALPRWRAAISLAVSALAVSNFLQVAVPNTFASRNLPLQVARAVAAQTTPADFFVTSGGDALFLYIPYFARRQTLAFSTLVLQAPGRNVEAALAGRRVRGGGGSGGTTRWADLQELGIRPEDFSSLRTRPAGDAAGVEVVEVLP